MPRPTYLTRSSRRLTLEGARLVLAAAVKKAESFDTPMDLAVADDSGYLLAFNRMDGARLTCIEMAMAKAWTAACSRRPTHEISEIAGPGKPAYGIHTSNPGRFTIVGGGLPIVVDGQVVGAIGCSGGTVQQDREVAAAAIEALNARLSPPRPAPRARARGRKRPHAHVRLLPPA